MLITRIPPPIDDLVARALADTPFLAEIAGAVPHQVIACAEISASLAAEQWESERHTVIAETLPRELIAAVALALVAHPETLRVQHETALHDALRRIKEMAAVIAALTVSIKGELPVPAAERQMDNVEGDLDRVRVALARAHEELLFEIAGIDRRRLDDRWGAHDANENGWRELEA